MIRINGTIELRRMIDALMQKSLVEMVRASRTEEGCLDYSFARHSADPDTPALFERAALDAHGQSAHIAEFQKIMAVNPPASRDLRVYEIDEGQ